MSTCALNQLVPLSAKEGYIPLPPFFSIFLLIIMPTEGFGIIIVEQGALRRIICNAA